MTPEQRMAVANALAAASRAFDQFREAMLVLKKQLDESGVFRALDQYAVGLDMAAPGGDTAFVARVSPSQVAAPANQAEELYNAGIFGQGPVHLFEDGEKNADELRAIVEAFDKSRDLRARFHDDKEDAKPPYDPDDPRGRVISLQVDGKRLLAQVVWSVDARKMIVTKTLTKLAVGPKDLLLSP